MISFGKKNHLLKCWKSLDKIISMVYGLWIFMIILFYDVKEAI